MPRILKRRPVAESVYDLAVARVARAFDRFDHITVSFSGGKDSTAVLQLAYAEAKKRGRLPLHVFTFDEEGIPLETEQYMRRVAGWPGIQFDWYCLPLRQPCACSREQPYWSPWDPDHEDLWMRPMPKEGIWRLPGVYDLPPMRDRRQIQEMVGRLFPVKQYGTVGMIMGIRAHESIIRTRAVQRRVADNYIIHDEGQSSQGNIYKVYPIYDWMTDDVWTAPAKLDWDYNRMYDVLEALGLPPHQQRACTPFGEECMRGVWVYQQGWPELWEKMCRRVPGAATAARYGRTELWSFSGKPEKPADMTWPQFLAHYLEQYQPQFRKQVAHRIAEEIGWHHSHTTDPILPKTQHPRTGVNWQFLLMIAVRGDFKKRKQAINQIWGRDREAVRKRWNKELAELQATDPATYALYQPIAGPIDPVTGVYVGGDHGGSNQDAQALAG